MPTNTVKTPVEPTVPLAENVEPVAVSPYAGKYIVLNDALSYRVAEFKDLQQNRGSGAITRAVGGQAIDLDPKLNNIDFLVSSKAVMHGDDWHPTDNPARRTSARIAAASQGAADDPVKTPVNEHEAKIAFETEGGSKVNAVS